MKHTQYTPGPWVIHSKVDGLNGQGIFSANGGYVYVATIHKPQQEANARLIAAAPDGLEFAKRMKLYFDNNPDGYEDLRLLCEAFIAKATDGNHE